MRKRGRPEVFCNEKRKAFAGLVELGASRRGAAVSLGIAPSTVTRRMERDPDFAGQVREAERLSETDLLTEMRRHCRKSWHATAWMLQCTRPERYCKRKGSNTLGASVDEVFDLMIGVLAEEIDDEELRTRIESRLNRLAAQEFMELPLPELDADEDKSTEADQTEIAVANPTEEATAGQAEPAAANQTEPAPDGKPVETSAALTQAANVPRAVVDSEHVRAMRQRIELKQRQRKLRNKLLKNCRKRPPGSRPADSGVQVQSIDQLVARRGPAAGLQ